jgi:hypothetical protein
VGSVLNFGGAGKFLVFFGKDVVHSVTRDESGGTERDIKFITSSVVIAADLAAPGWYFDSEQGGDDWWCKTVESSINVPPVETCEIKVVFLGDDGLVECCMVRVLELDVLKTFIRLDESITDDLDLRLVGDCLQVWVQDAALCVQGLAVAVTGGNRIEALSELELGLGRDVALVLEDYDLVAEERVFNDFEVGI